MVRGMIVSLVRDGAERDGDHLGGALGDGRCGGRDRHGRGLCQYLDGYGKQ